MTFYEIVQFAILVVLGVTLAVFWRQLNIVRSDFRVRMRPYLGFTNITMEKIREARRLEFAVPVKNFGFLPAKDAKLSGEFIVAGEEPAFFEAGTKGSVFPSDEARWVVGATDVDRDAILGGAKKLQLRLKVEYRGSGRESYWTSSNRTYHPQGDDWRDEEGNWT